jgi:hypothetical protein
MPSSLSLLATAFGAQTPLEPFSASDGVGRALLLGRVGLLAVVFWAAVRRGDVQARRWLAWAGAAFVASLAARAALLPFVLVALIAAARTRGTLAAAGGVLGLALVVAVLVKPDSLDPFAPGEPAAMTRLWSERDNAFWAHQWARRWAAQETEPGQGALALARTSWALGHASDARREAEAVAERGADPAVRAQAQAALAQWAPPAGSAR